jgi:hypothetical protein
MSPIRTILATALLAFIPSLGFAQCFTNQGPCVFAPGSCAYTLQNSPATYSGGHQFSLLDFESSNDCAPLPADGVTDIQVVHATFLGFWTPNGGPLKIVSGPAILTIKVTGGPAVNPRPLSTELLAMDLTGVSFPSGVLVRESPTQASVGHADITELSPGSFKIDSFFDVFTELTLDGGQSWFPSPDLEHIDMSQGPPDPAHPTTWGALKATYR